MHLKECLQAMKSVCSIFLTFSEIRQIYLLPICTATTQDFKQRATKRFNGAFVGVLKRAVAAPTTEIVY
jgi:hypothetical protein